MNLSPHATAAHPAARHVGRPWAEDFNCWHLVQTVQKEVFGRSLPNIPLDADQNQTAALLAVSAGWSRVLGPPVEGDVLTMIGPRGQHVGTMADGRVLHNLGGKNADGTVWGQVKASDLHELGMLGYGHIKVWRVQA